MTKEITQAEIDFIKERYPDLHVSVAEPVQNEPTIIFSRSLDPTKVKISRRRLNPPPFHYAATCIYCACSVYKSQSPEGIANPRAIRTRDHITPKCDGGVAVATACTYCNHIRGSDPVEVFIAFLETKPPYEGREKAFRFFKRDLMLAALHARNLEAPRGFDFIPHPRGTYTLKDLRKDRWNGKMI